MRERERKMSLLAKLKAEECEFFLVVSSSIVSEGNKYSIVWFMCVLSGLFMSAFLITQICLNKIPLKRACTPEKFPKDA